jgi:hypothetical protein
MSPGIGTMVCVTLWLWKLGNLPKATEYLPRGSMARELYNRPGRARLPWWVFVSSSGDEMGCYRSVDRGIFTVG